MKWSIVIPTFRRAEVLAECLEHLVRSDLPAGSSEVLVLDNGGPELSEGVVEGYREKLPVSYFDNGIGHSLGYSLRRGVGLARGEIIVELNDDALVPSDFFSRILAVFDSDPRIGVLGVRADEDGYKRDGEAIGRIDERRLGLIGNFDMPTAELIEVEHVYGFCFAYRRNVFLRGAKHDALLLARDDSNGCCIETDQCLTAARLGYRVVYDGTISVRHLAKPRVDISERSPRWRQQYLCNMSYLYLKHFGWFGRGRLGMRFLLLHDLGLLSFVRSPNLENWNYFWGGVCGKLRAGRFWLEYFCRSCFGLNEKESELSR